jgi:hypothetical protein
MRRPGPPIGPPVEARAMTTPILLFLAFGALFGLATYSRRHLFSEGTTARRNVASDPLDTRLMWTLICSCLWPLMIVTGTYSALRRARINSRRR